MPAYILRRLLLVIPTLLGILLINFVIVQAAPGGPVEQAIAKAKGLDTRGNPVSGSAAGDMTSSGSASQQDSPYRGAQGLDPELIKDLERQYGFDKPASERFLLMLGKGLFVAILAPLAVMASAWFATHWIAKRLGGYTGDTLGAVQQKAEIVFLVVAALFIGR